MSQTGSITTKEFIFEMILSMKIIGLTFFSAIIFAHLSGCTSVKVSNVDPSLKISHVCIEKNPKVIVGDFLPVVQEGFTRHGITTEIYKENLPAYCKYHLTYTAFRKWGMANYMHHAELRLYKGNEKIGDAEYHLNGGGGLALNKWASVESKMDPVIDQLLAAYTPEAVDKYRSKVPEIKSTTRSQQQESLEILNAWHTDGLIDDDEYEREKRRILSEL